MDEAIYEKFAPVLESLDRNILFIASTLETTLNLTNGIFEIHQKQLDLAKENAERMTRQADLGELDRPEPEPSPIVEDDRTEPDLKEDDSFSFGDILKALALAPFAFKFAKGFISAITDDLIDVTMAGITGFVAMIRGDMNKMFMRVGKAFKFLSSPFTFMANLVGNLIKSVDSINDVIKNISLIFKNLSTSFKAGLTGARAIVRNADGTFKALNIFEKFFANIGKVFTSGVQIFSKLSNGVKSFFGMFKTVGNFVKSALAWIPGTGILKSILGKLALPITLLLGAVEAVKSFMNAEGAFIERFGAGVGGFFAEIIGAPLDLLKGVVAWVLGKFGFENAAKALNSFSFSDIIRNIVGGMFGALSDIVDGVVAIFNGDLSGIGQLFSGIVDTVLSPINAAINFVQGIFGWDDPEEPFRLSTFISDKWQVIKTWFTDKFSWQAITDEWSNLTSVVSGVWGSVKGWFSEKLSFGDDKGEDFSIKALFNTVIEKLKTFFSDLFDFLPTLDEIKSQLTAMLPDWMKPEAVEESRLRIQQEIAEQEQYISEGDMYNWRGKGRERIVQELRDELNSLPQGERGGIINAPKSGTPVVLHDQEAIIPLDSPNAANIIRGVAGVTTLERKTISLEQGSMVVSTKPAPVIVTGGNMARGGDTYNNGGNTSTTTIINQSSDPVRALRHMPM